MITRLNCKGHVTSNYKKMIVNDEWVRGVKETVALCINAPLHHLHRSLSTNTKILSDFTRGAPHTIHITSCMRFNIPQEANVILSQTELSLMRVSRL